LTGYHNSTPNRPKNIGVESNSLELGKSICQIYIYGYALDSINIINISCHAMARSCEIPITPSILILISLHFFFLRPHTDMLVSAKSKFSYLKNKNCICRNLRAYRMAKIRTRPTVIQSAYILNIENNWYIHV